MFHSSKKVLRDKPESAFDFCYIGNDYSTKVTDKARCDADPVLVHYQSPDSSREAHWLEAS
jgi:hypothetical protein